MTSRTLIRRSLRFHARAHLGVVLGAAIGSAVLIGALLVGDSVRGTLRERALARLGGAELALDAGDRFFEQSLADRLQSRYPPVYFPTLTNRPPPPLLRSPHLYTPLLHLPGTMSRQDVAARANSVQVWGVSSNSFSHPRIGASDFSIFSRPSQDLLAKWRRQTDLPQDGVILNEALATRLNAKVGDSVVLRIHKPSALSRDAVITPRDDMSVAMRLRVNGIVGEHEYGNLNLSASQIPPLNAFVRLEELAAAAELQGRANVLLAAPMNKLPKVRGVAKWVHQLNGLLAKISPRLVIKMKREPVAAEAEEQVHFMNTTLHQAFELADAELSVRPTRAQTEIELSTPRIFLDDAVIAGAVQTGAYDSARAAGYLPRPFSPVTTTTLQGLPFVTNYIGILTYLANLIRAGDRTTPYSMITAAGPPYTPADLGENEILVNEWLAEDLAVKAGDEIDVSYYLADSGAQLLERTNRFRVRAVVPLEGIYADRALMPEFPGLAKAESTHDWDAGFPLVHKIRDKDEAYWKQHRGTPKAFVSLATGQRLWGNRFGKLTAIRWPIPEKVTAGEFRGAIQRNLLSNLAPATVGLSFYPVRQRALAAVSQGQDFGQLFLGLSFFLIVAALILMALLFQFGLEQRASEVGTFLALGFTPKQVRRLFLREALMLALIGAVIGTFGAVAYSQLMLRGLSTIWRDAVQTSGLQFHAEPGTILIGLLAAVMVCTVTILLVLRKQASRPARELLTEDMHTTRSAPVHGRTPAMFALLMLTGAAILVVWALAKDEVSPAVFFSVGPLVLVAGVFAMRALFSALSRQTSLENITLGSLGLRGCIRRHKRSLAIVIMLACGTFMVISVGANRRDADRNAFDRKSGTGGFALIGQTSIPIVHDLNTSAGREFFGLSDRDLEGVSFVPMRVKEGDDASCLNLNRAQRPRILGVNPDLLLTRNAFTFPKGGWPLLQQQPADRSESNIPTIGDENSIRWALDLKVGDTLELTDDVGRDFKLQIAGTLANSILQGNLLISEKDFVARFPHESGYRMFLIDAPSNRVTEVAATLSRAMQDVGLDLVPAARRLAEFNAVQNTYLNTFQILGGLGLVLGSVGLGVIVLRNVFERRGELGVLQALGLRRRRLQWFVLSEHLALLGLGTVVGVVAALIAVLPALLAPGAATHYRALLFTVLGIVASGLVWTWLATCWAMRGELLKALRNE